MAFGELDTDDQGADVLKIACRHLLGAWALADVVDTVRHHMIREALERSQGNLHRAAKLLGIDRAYLRRRVRTLDEPLTHMPLPPVMTRDPEETEP